MALSAGRPAGQPARRETAESEIDPARCPICAQPNACGAAAGRDECWCFAAKLAPEALARIPEPLLGVACVCAECGRGEAPCARG